MMLAHVLVCRCGNLRSVCSNPDIDWHPYENVCWATAAADWKVRQLRAEHTRDKRDDTEPWPLDGLTVGVSDVDVASMRSEAAGEQ